MDPFRIGFPLYEQVDLIDVTVPYDIFSRVTAIGGRPLQLLLIGPTMQPVTSGQKFRITPDVDFATCPQLDLIWVPGSQRVPQPPESVPLVSFINRQAARATWVTSVCTGALLLNQAHLLDGYQATTHWAAVEQLEQNKAVQVAVGYPRYVRDRNRVTGGGVTSSIDEALAIVAMLTDNDTAFTIQKYIQYQWPPAGAQHP